MIIQCDHCAAKFRMDDAKLANGPVKVRCAKCKEVFVVQPEEPVVAETVAPVVPQEAPQEAPSMTETAGTSEFSFETEPAGTSELSSDSPAGSGTAFAGAPDDFSFDVETPPAATSPSDDQADEFDWQGGATSESSGGKGEFDLSSFESSLETSVSAPVPSGAVDTDFDFGDVDLSGAQAPSPDSKPEEDKSADGFSLDFGEVSFSEHQAESVATADSFSEPSAGQPSEFDFSEKAPETSASEDFLLSFNTETAQQEQVPAVGKAEEEKVNFGEFSFGEMGEVAEKESKSPEMAAPKMPFTENFAETFAPSQQEELPPTSLTTRKKSGSLFPVSVIAGAIVLVLILAGSGAYFFGGPKVFSRIGLGFLVAKSGDEGNIALKGVAASYLVNNTAGELFVVRGEAVNNFKKPRASVQIKVTLLGTGGTTIVSKSAFCGNPLSNEQLTTLPLAKIEESMNNQFGDSLVNLGLKPGETIPFVVVISPVPKEATDFSVVVGGSTVATQ